MSNSAEHGARLPLSPDHGDVEAVSFELGLRRCVGDLALYERLLERFLTTRLSMPTDIESAVEGGRHDAAAHIAHAAISTAGIIGATALSDAARDLQHAISSNRAAIPVCMAAFATTHANVANWIRRYFSTAPEDSDGAK